MKLLSHPAVRQSLGLVTGLLVGIVGAVLFQQSLPPETTVAPAPDTTVAPEIETTIPITTVAPSNGSFGLCRSKRTSHGERRSLVLPISFPDLS